MHAPVIYDTHLTNSQSAKNDGSKYGTTIIIGNGPAGMRCAQELLKRDKYAKVLVFGNEPYQPYNRVRLTALLAGEINYADIITPLPDNSDNPGLEFIYEAICAIEPASSQVVDVRQQTYHYDNLVIATGSNPHVPNIPGVDQTGVYTFRNLKDTESLYGRVARARHIVIVGGGLLGLEAARALQRANTQITIIQQGEYLMNRQLDKKAASLLREKVEALGIKVITQDGVREIEGNGRVTGVKLRNGDHLNCDTVVFCAGIKPEITLARTANIKVNNGIVVDDRLLTSENNIYAIGECSEHKGITYGLVNPGFEQAAIVADAITEGNSSYRGSLEVSRLKVLGEKVSSMGIPNLERKEPFTRQVIYQQKKQGIYRKIILRKSKLIGAVGYGEWPELRRIQEAYQQERHIWPWQLAKFWMFGEIFGDETTSVKDWPSSTIVCQCNNISQGQLVDAIAAGNTELKSLQKTTTAGTVCGSCNPLLQNLLGKKESLEKDKYAWGLAIFALISCVIIAALAMIPALSPSDSVQTPTAFEWLWNDKFYKQVTGFTLLGITALGLLFSIRKRIKNTQLGAFIHWRFSHIVLTAIAAAMLIAHTGFNLGSNLNFYLISNFMLVVVMGALTALIMAAAHLIRPSQAQTIRSSLRWGHILVMWPLPVLIISHILSVYYF